MYMMYIKKFFFKDEFFWYEQFFDLQCNRVKAAKVFVRFGFCRSSITKQWQRKCNYFQGQG